MPFTGDPVNNAIDRVRLMVGDTDPQFEFLDDSTYQFVLDKNNDNEKSAARESARYILAYIARFTRERTGDIEVYGKEFFENYRQLLMDLINNPNFSDVLPMPYAGGISKQDMLDNNNKIDNNHTQFYIGYSTSTPTYEEVEYDGPFEI